VRERQGQLQTSWCLLSGADVTCSASSFLDDNRVVTYTPSTADSVESRSMSEAKGEHFEVDEKELRAAQKQLHDVQPPTSKLVHGAALPEAKNVLSSLGKTEPPSDSPKRALSTHPGLLSSHFPRPEELYEKYDGDIRAIFDSLNESPRKALKHPPADAKDFARRYYEGLYTDITASTK
jgi:hypothetical protein